MAGRDPREHGGVPLRDHEAEPAAGPQHLAGGDQRLGRVVDDLEHAVAQHEVDAAGRDEVGEVLGVALHPAQPVGDAVLGRATGQRGQRVGAGVDDGDAVARRREPHRLAAGAAPEVEDVARRRAVAVPASPSPAEVPAAGPHCSSSRSMPAASTGGWSTSASLVIGVRRP